MSEFYYGGNLPTPHPWNDWECNKMDFCKFLSSLNNETIWVVVTAISGATAAIAALFTIYHARKTWKEQIESNRPYFTIKAPGVKELPDSPLYRMQITLENVGIRPAFDLSGKIYIVDKNLNKKPDFTFDVSVANDIPPNTPTPWYNDTLQLPTNVPPKYIVFAFRYNDPIINEVFAQVYYMKWDGVKNGTISPNFDHVSMDEKGEIIEHLEELLKPFIFKTSF